MKFQLLMVNPWHGRDARSDHKLNIIVCDRCGALVMEENKNDHEDFHDSVDHAQPYEES